MNRTRGNGLTGFLVLIAVIIIFVGAGYSFIREPEALPPPQTEEEVARSLAEKLKLAREARDARLPRPPTEEKKPPVRRVVDFVERAGSAVSKTVKSIFSPHTPAPEDSAPAESSPASHNNPPHVSLNASPLIGVVPLGVSFDGSGSDPDGDPIAFHLAFGDGEVILGKASATHTYRNAGIFVATLTVSDGALSKSAPVTITVSLDAVAQTAPPPPPVTITVKPEEAVIQQTPSPFLPPKISSRVEITDTNHWVSQTNAWLTNFARVGDFVYIIYLASYNPQGAPSGRSYMRKLNMLTQEIGPAVEMFPGRIQPLSAGSNNPTLLKDGTGALMALLPLWDAVGEITSGILAQGTPTVGIARLLADPDNPATWTDGAPASGHLRTRMSNAFGASYCSLPWANGKWTCGYAFERPMTLYDSNTRTSYLKATSHRLRGQTLDGSVVQNAESDVFHRIESPFSVLANADGPYVLIEGENHAFDPPVTGASSGQTVPASKLFLGRETAGPKTLYSMWFSRSFFKAPGSPHPDGILWNRDLHLAISRDKGVTWSNRNGSFSQSIASRIRVDDPRFLIEPGNYRAEYSEWGADVDVDGNLHLLLHRYRGAESDYYTPGTMNVNWFGSYPANIDALPMDLIYVRFAPDGTRYESPTPLLSPRLGSGLPHRIQIVTGRRGEVLAVSEQPVRYNYSSDNGVTWGGWVTIDGAGNSRLFTQLLRDSDDPLLIHLLYHTYTTLHENKLYWRSIRFGA